MVSRRMRQGTWVAAMISVAALISAEAWKLHAQDAATATSEQAGDAAEGTAGEAASEVSSYFANLMAVLEEGKDLAALEKLYAEKAVREDSLGRYEGRAAVAKELLRLRAGMNSFAVEMRDEFVSGEETVTLWTATYRHDSLRGGEEIQVDGMTHIKTEGGLIVAQRDYFDLGQAAYENISVVGSIVQWVKGKMQAP